MLFETRPTRVTADKNIRMAIEELVMTLPTNTSIFFAKVSMPGYENLVGSVTLSSGIVVQVYFDLKWVDPSAEPGKLVLYYAEGEYQMFLD